MSAPRRWRLKSGKPILAAVGLALCGSLFLRGQLEPWVQHTPSGRAIAALFRTVPMPGGTVPVLRPPAEARPALTAMIAAAPAMLPYTACAARSRASARFRGGGDRLEGLRGQGIRPLRCANRTGRFLSSPPALARRTGRIDGRRNCSGRSPQPATAQRGWESYERMSKLINEEALPEGAADPVFRAWVARYPKQPAAWRKLIDHLSSAGQFAAAETEIAAYGRNFHDEFEPVRMRAAIEIQRGAPGAALAIYDRAFQPLWPDEMRAAYFKLLADQEQLPRVHRTRSHRAGGKPGRPYCHGAAVSLFSVAE